MPAPQKRIGRGRRPTPQTLADGNGSHSDAAAWQSQAIDPTTHPIIAAHWFGIVAEAVTA